MSTCQRDWHRPSRQSQLTWLRECLCMGPTSKTDAERAVGVSVAAANPKGPTHSGCHHAGDAANTTTPPARPLRGTRPGSCRAVLQLSHGSAPTTTSAVAYSGAAFIPPSSSNCTCGAAPDTANLASLRSASTQRHTLQPPPPPSPDPHHTAAAAHLPAPCCPTRPDTKPQPPQPSAPVLSPAQSYLPQRRDPSAAAATGLRCSTGPAPSPPSTHCAISASEPGITCIVCTAADAADALQVDEDAAARGETGAETSVVAVAAVAVGGSAAAYPTGYAAFVHVNLLSESQDSRHHPSSDLPPPLQPPVPPQPLPLSLPLPPLSPPVEKVRPVRLSQLVQTQLLPWANDGSHPPSSDTPHHHQQQQQTRPSLPRPHLPSGRFPDGYIHPHTGPPDLRGAARPPTATPRAARRLEYDLPYAHSSQPQPGVGGAAACGAHLSGVELKAAGGGGAPADGFAVTDGVGGGAGAAAAAGVSADCATELDDYFLDSELALEAANRTAIWVAGTSSSAVLSSIRNASEARHFKHHNNGDDDDDDDNDSYEEEADTEPQQEEEEMGMGYGAAMRAALASTQEGSDPSSRSSPLRAPGGGSGAAAPAGLAHYYPPLGGGSGGAGGVSPGPAAPGVLDARMTATSSQQPSQLRRSVTERFLRGASKRGIRLAAAAAASGGAGGGGGGGSAPGGAAASAFLSQGLLLSAALRMSEGQEAVQQQRRMRAKQLQQQQWQRQQWQRQQQQRMLMMTMPQQQWQWQQLHQYQQQQQRSRLEEERAKTSHGMAVAPPWPAGVATVAATAGTQGGGRAAMAGG